MARTAAFSKAIRAQQFGVMALRAALYRVNVELARDPYMVRLARALTAFGIDTVLDVGANIGQFGSALHACGYRDRIISCEPQPDAFAHLSRRSASDPKWTALRTAVGAEQGTIDINVSANSFSSSVLPMSQAHLTVAPGSGYVGTESAPMTTVADLIREHGIDPARTLLKSDTQGYESSVFDGAADTLALFTAVQVELSLVPLYDGQALAPELTERLEGLGFGVFALDPGFGDRSNGRMLQYDGLFVRADLLTDYSRRGVAVNRAQAKTRAIYAARTALHRAGFDLVRDPFRYRFLHALERRSINEVLDIGANVGQFGDELRAGSFRGRIVSVEPLHAAYAALAARARADASWQVERAAVSDAAGTLTMNVSANSVSSSALPILAQSTAAAPESGYVGTEEVETTTVDDLVERHALVPERALLKIDVQGFERPVLDGAKATLDRFAAVRTELTLAPLYEGQTLMPEMVAFLAERGFELWVIEPGFSDPVTHRLLQFDGTFVRR